MYIQFHSHWLILSFETTIDVRDSMMKSMQRALQREFRESLIFINVKNRVYLMSDNLKYQEISAQCMNLKSISRCISTYARWK